MAKSRQGIGDVWRRAGLIQRIMLLTVLLAFAGGGVMLVNWARKPRLCLLYSGLAPEDASKIVDKLRDSDIPYELRSGGTAVYVPEDQAYSLRLDMASQGLPNGDQEGYRILDGDSFGTSPFTQRVNLRRAIEGELARTIQMLEGVVSARVHVARAEPSLFTSRQNNTSATVALRLKPGHQLIHSNIAAIVHLVAGSVEGLSAQNVVVVDSQGNLLSSQTNDEFSQGATSMLTYKTQLERALALKAEDVLLAALGPNRACVRVEATIETSSSEELDETYLPDGKVTSKEELKTKSTTPGGKDGSGGGATKEETTLSEYLVPRKTTRKNEPAGNVTSVTASVVVDLSPRKKADGSEGEDAPAITEEQVTDLVVKAIGAAKGDVTVVSGKFEAPSVAAVEGIAESGMFSQDFILEVVKRSSLGILVLGALLVLKMFGGSKKTSGDPEPALEGAVAGEQGLLPASGGGNPALVRDQIARALKSNPDQVKQLFLTWVQSDEGGE